MPVETCHPFACCEPWAELCCHIGLNCSPPVCHGAARGHCLALSPGTVAEDAALCQGAQTAQISLPACKEYVAEKLSVPVAPSCRTADGPLCRIDTTTTKQASARAVRAGDTVTYRITFTNYSSVPLDMVWIYDDVQQGVIPGSIRPAPGPGETLRTGIAMGTVGPGQSVVLTYDVTASFAGGLPMASRAWVQYCCTDHCGRVHRGTGGRRCCAVFQLPDRRPVCRWVWRRFSICDFRQFRYFYVYHRGVDRFQTSYGCAWIIKFGIAVKYIDCQGEKRGRFFEDSVQIPGLAEDLEPSESSIRLTGLTCRAEDPRSIAAGFKVTINPRQAPPVSGLSGYWG